MSDNSTAPIPESPKPETPLAPKKRTNPLDPYFQSVFDRIQAANSILILLPQNHTIDNVAAGLSLYLSLTNFYQDSETPKSITIASPTQTTVAYQRLYSVSDIVDQLGSKNLVVTFNTDFENIEQVNTDNTDGKFNLIVETKEGANQLTENDFSFSFRGVDADLVIAIDHNTPEDAGNFYLTEKDLFNNRSVVSISINPNSVPLSETYLKDTLSSGVCELVAKFLRYAKINLNPDIATNLIAGIEAVTNNFAIRAGAETFSIMGSLLRFGGKRFHLTKPTNAKPGAMKNFYKRANVNQSISAQPAPSTPQPVQKNDKKDWTKPKIYKGGTLNKG